MSVLSLNIWGTFCDLSVVLQCQCTAFPSVLFYTAGSSVSTGSSVFLHQVFVKGHLVQFGVGFENTEELSCLLAYAVCLMQFISHFPSRKHVCNHTVGEHTKILWSQDDILGVFRYIVLVPDQRCRVLCTQIGSCYLC